jgi:hypothetical protein
VPLQVTPLHAAISTRSTIAQPGAGIGSHTCTPFFEHELDRVADHLPRFIGVLSLRVNLGELGHMHVDPAVPCVLEDCVERERGHGGHDTAGPRR